MPWISSGSRDDRADGQARVQRRVRVLEDHLHIAALAAQLARARRRQFHAHELDRAGRRLVELEDGPSDRRLAAAGLADQAERLATADAERHVVDRSHPADPALEDPLAHRELHPQVLDREQVALPDVGSTAGTGCCGETRSCGLPGRLCVRVDPCRGRVARVLPDVPRDRAASRSARPPSTRPNGAAPTGISDGFSWMDRSTAYGQRGWNGQPSGRSIRSGGTPVIGVRREPRGWSRRGIEAISPSVYGWRGSRKISSTGADSTM